jgi:hypothetical protein
MNTRKLTMFAACLIVSIGVFAMFRSADARDAGPADKYKDELNTLLKQRVETAQYAHDAVQAAYDAETATLDWLLDAINKLIEAEVATATGQREEIAALEKHVQLIKQVEDKTKALYEKGAKGGEAKDYYTVKRERESAEIALLKKRLKVKQ